jgi:signal transduction histidine kinase
MTTQSSPLRRRRPLHLVLAGVVLTLLLCGGLIWIVDDIESSHDALAEDNLALTRLSGRLQYLDEVLTNSALLTAATGDVSWRARYTETEPEMARALSEALRLSPDDATLVAARVVDEAHRALVDLALRAFGLVEAGKADRAWELLTGETYEEQQEVYRASLDGLRRATDMRTMTTLATLHEELQEWILYGTAGGAAVASLWILLLGLLQREFAARDRRETEAADAAERAGRESDRSSRFLATMSHEIRTPMTGVLGMAELLSESRLTRDQRETLDVIRSSGETLLTVIDDILDVSKMDAGQLRLEIIPFDLSTLLSDVCSLQSFRARELGISLQHHVDAQLPQVVLGDPTRLRQVLANLVSNAVKFTHEGGVEVRCAGELRADGILDVLLQVRDSGIGIPEDRREDLFQDYGQAGASTSREYGGTGLGLAISRRLVELMGGEIAVDSIPDEGSIFSVLLPLGVALDGEALAPTDLAPTDLAPPDLAPTDPAPTADPALEA